MKYSIAVAVLIGLVQAKKSKQDTTTVWSLRSINDFRENAGIQNMFGDYATGNANGQKGSYNRPQEQFANPSYVQQ